jgi:hypothetical protein
MHSRMDRWCKVEIKPYALNDTLVNFDCYVFVEWKSLRLKPCKKETICVCDDGMRR